MVAEFSTSCPRSRLSPPSFEGSGFEGSAIVQALLGPGRILPQRRGVSRIDLSGVRAADRVLIALVVTVLLGVFFLGRGYSKAPSHDLSPETPRSDQLIGRADVHQPATISIDEEAVTVAHIAEIIRSVDSRVGARESEELAQVIVEESSLGGYDPLFVAAVIKAESTFRNSAVSHQGAQGLMQIMPGTGQYISQKRSFAWQGAHRLNEPAYNIRLGLAYLRYLEESYKFDREQMLIAYNWGPNNLTGAMRRGASVPRESRHYARTILETHQKWRRDLGTRLAWKELSSDAQSLG